MTYGTVIESLVSSLAVESYSQSVSETLATVKVNVPTAFFTGSDSKVTCPALSVTPESGKKGQIFFLDKWPCFANVGARRASRGLSPEP